MQPFCEPSKLFDAIQIPDLILKAYDFDPKKYTDNLFSYFDITKPDGFERMVDKRKAEFLCGRYAARQGLNALGISAQQVPIGHNRAPVFPPNVLGSISHVDDMALAVVAFTNKFGYLGVDVEKIVSTSLRTELENQIINQAEKQHLTESRIDPDVGFTLVFSAKESLFKALHPTLNHYFSFDAAELIALCVQNNQIEFKLTQTLSNAHPRGQRISGYFHSNEQYVLTIIHKQT